MSEALAYARAIRSSSSTNQARIILFLGRLSSGEPVDVLKPLKGNGYLQKSIDTLVKNGLVSLRFPRGFGWKRRYRLTKLGLEVFKYLNDLDWSHLNVYL